MHRHIGIGNDVWIGYEAVIFSGVSNVLEMKSAKSCKNPFRCIERKHNGLIKVITGIRRCGKSYLLNTIFYHHLLEQGVDVNHIIRFAFDSADGLSLIDKSLIQIAIHPYHFSASFCCIYNDFAGKIM